MAKAKSKTKTTTLYSPAGTKITVGEGKAGKLKRAGYTEAKPKS